MNVNEFKIYIPSYSSGNCAYIYNSDIIRVYDSEPRANTTVAYKDYYIKSGYIHNSGSTTFNNYSTLPTCIASSRITTDYFYRQDLDKILVCFFIILIVCFYFPYRVISRMFGRWFKW